MPYLGHHYTSV